MAKLLRSLIFKAIWIFGFSLVCSFCLFQIIQRVSGCGWVVYGVVCFGYGFILLCVWSELKKDEEIADEFLVIMLFLILLPFVKSYVCTFLIALVWLLREVRANYFDEIKYINETKKEEKRKKDELLEKCGEDNFVLYNEVLKKTDELIDFSKGLGVKCGVWIEIKKFLTANPEKIGMFVGLFNQNVEVILDVYHKLPKDNLGKIDLEYRSIPKAKSVLSLLNESVEKMFEDKMWLDSMEIESSLTAVERMLKGNILG